MITKYNFSELFAKAWLRTCLTEIICNGFKKAGIIPFQPDALIKHCPGYDGMVELQRKTLPSTSYNMENVQPIIETNLQLQLSAENSQFSANDVAEDGLQPTGGQSESSHAENSTTTSNSPFFSAEKEQLFRQLFEEAYNLNFWLRINHPDD